MVVVDHHRVHHQLLQKTKFSRDLVMLQHATYGFVRLRSSGSWQHKGHMGRETIRALER